MESKKDILKGLLKKRLKVACSTLSASDLEKKKANIAAWEKRKANFDKALHLVNEYIEKNQQERGKHSKWKQVFLEYSTKFESILGDDH